MAYCWVEPRELLAGKIELALSILMMAHEQAFVLKNDAENYRRASRHSLLRALRSGLVRVQGDLEGFF